MSRQLLFYGEEDGPEVGGLEYDIIRCREGFWSSREFGFLRRRQAFCAPVSSLEGAGRRRGNGGRMFEGGDLQTLIKLRATLASHSCPPFVIKNLAGFWDSGNGSEF